MSGRKWCSWRKSVLNLRSTQCSIGGGPQPLVPVNVRGDRRLRRAGHDIGGLLPVLEWAVRPDVGLSDVAEDPAAHQLDGPTEAAVGGALVPHLGHHARAGGG